MKIKNLYIGWVYTVVRMRVTMVGTDVTFNYRQRGVKLALLKKKMLGRYEDLETNITHYKISPFSSEGNLVVSDNKSDFLHFIEVFEDANNQMTEEEALSRFTEYRDKIYTKQRGGNRES